MNQQAIAVRCGEMRPLPEIAVTIRDGELRDVEFMDELQRVHRHQVGWFPRKALEGKIELGHVLIAEAGGERVGYCIGTDRYFKRDDVGIIYQLNVAKQKQRGLVGATLLRAMFERSAYGCRLYCCWCAQDIEANRFWESMGFVPLAFRTGSRTRGKDAAGKSAPRVHIFWQKRIRAGDTGDVSRGGTPWWFPYETGGGTIREDRLVLPIPPGMSWSDAMPVVLPGAAGAGGKKLIAGEDAGVRLPGDSRESKAAGGAPGGGERGKRAAPRRRRRKKRADADCWKGSIGQSGLWFVAAKQESGNRAGEITDEGANVRAKRSRKSQGREKNDARLSRAARELRDRWLEQLNEAPPALVGKYDVCRRVAASASPRAMLQQAA